MIFTKTEKDLLIQNTKQIFDYLEKNVAPFLKKAIYYDFEDNPTSYKLRLRVHPINDDFVEIELKRAAINSTTYKLGDKYDSKYVKNGDGKDIFTNYDVMYHLIMNWKNIKEDFTQKVSKMKDDIKILQNFKV